MKLKTLALAAIVALAALVAPPARALECDQLTGGYGICLPRYGTDFDQWALSDIAALTLLNNGSTGAVVTADWLQARRLSGLSTGTPNIWVSSPTIFSQSTSPVATGFFTVSSGSFLAQSTSPTAGHVVLGIRNNAGAELVRVQQDGKVGIGTSVVPSSAAVAISSNVSVSGRVEVSSWTLTGSGHSGADFDATGSGTLTVRSKGGMNFMLDTDNDDSERLRVYKNGMTAGTAEEVLELDTSGNLETIGDLTASDALISGDDATIGDDAVVGDDLIVNDQGVVKGTFTVQGAMGLTASSGTFTATGAANPFAVTSSTGIRMNTGAFEMGSGGFIRFSNGTTLATAPSASSYTVGFDSSTTLGSLSFPGSGATANNVCVARSTLTVTGHGCPVQVIFNAPVNECNSNQQLRTSFLLNGAFVTGISAGVEPGNTQCGGTGVAANGGFDIKIPAPSAGTLNFCAIAYSSVGNFESGTTRPQFRVVELCNISN